VFEGKEISAMEEKRYNSINAALQKRFGCRVFKVTLESGCICPNRDGTIGSSGCAFCNEESYEVSSNLAGGMREIKNIADALRCGIEYVKKRHNAAKFVSYFQSGSNTNAPVERLRKIFDEATDHPDVVGLAVATRPDCIPDSHLGLLEEYSKKTMLWVELGLQSANDKTLKLLKRGHSAADFASAVKKLKERNITVCAHIILGLPGESAKDMLNTADFLNKIKIDGVKIHNLHILKGTLFEEWYRKGKMKVCGLSTYAKWAADFIEHLDPSIMIHRVNGHAPKNLTVAPRWSVNKLAIFNAVEKELERRDGYQGKKLKPTAGGLF
jgi:radical SAM protein (TIGR01212 family)